MFFDFWEARCLQTFLGHRSAVYRLPYGFLTLVRIGKSTGEVQTKTELARVMRLLRGRRVVRSFGRYPTSHRHNCTLCGPGAVSGFMPTMI